MSVTMNILICIFAVTLSFDFAKSIPNLDDENLKNRLLKRENYKIPSADDIAEDWIQAQISADKQDGLVSEENNDLENRAQIMRDSFSIGDTWMVKKYCVKSKKEKNCIEMGMKPGAEMDSPIKIRIRSDPVVIIKRGREDSEIDGNAIDKSFEEIYDSIQHSENHAPVYKEKSNEDNVKLSRTVRSAINNTTVRKHESTDDIFTEDEKLTKDLEQTTKQPRIRRLKATKPFTEAPRKIKPAFATSTNTFENEKYTGKSELNRNNRNGGLESRDIQHTEKNTLHEKQKSKDFISRKRKIHFRSKNRPFLKLQKESALKHSESKVSENKASKTNESDINKEKNATGTKDSTKVIRTQENAKVIDTKKYKNIPETIPTVPEDVLVPRTEEIMIVKVRITKRKKAENSEVTGTVEHFKIPNLVTSPEDSNAFIKNNTRKHMEFNFRSNSTATDTNSKKPEFTNQTLSGSEEYKEKPNFNDQSRNGTEKNSEKLEFTDQTRNGTERNSEKPEFADQSSNGTEIDTEKPETHAERQEFGYIETDYNQVKLYKNISLKDNMKHEGRIQTHGTNNLTIKENYFFYDMPAFNDNSTELELNKNRKKVKRSVKQKNKKKRRSDKCKCSDESPDPSSEVTKHPCECPPPKDSRDSKSKPADEASVESQSKDSRDSNSRLSENKGENDSGSCLCEPTTPDGDPSSEVTKHPCECESPKGSDESKSIASNEDSREPSEDSKDSKSKADSGSCACEPTTTDPSSEVTKDPCKCPTSKPPNDDSTEPTSRPPKESKDSDSLPNESKLDDDSGSCACEPTTSDPSSEVTKDPCKCPKSKPPNEDSFEPTSRPSKGTKDYDSHPSESKGEDDSDSCGCEPSTTPGSHVTPPCKCKSPKDKRDISNEDSLERSEDRGKHHGSKKFHFDSNPSHSQELGHASSTGPHWHRCGLPQKAKNTEILCKKWPEAISCNIFCAHGTRLPEGIKRTTSCKYKEGKWSKKFSECSPFVDCSLQLKRAGSMACQTQTLKEGVKCDISCEKHGNHAAIKRTTHKCTHEGRWSPEIPHCVESEGIDVLEPPSVLAHEDISYPKEYPK